MIYNPGDKVRFLEFQGGGIIQKKLSDNIFEILSEDGFTFSLQPHQFIEDKSHPLDFDKKVKKKDISQNARSSLSKLRRQHVADLHYKQGQEQLSNSQIIALQLNKFNLAIHEAFSKKQDEVVIIHGVGNGVLKEKIYTELRHHRLVKSFKEADIKTYGKGATLVILERRINTL